MSGGGRCEHEAEQEAGTGIRWLGKNPDCGRERDAQQEKQQRIGTELLGKDHETRQQRDEGRRSHGAGRHFAERANGQRHEPQAPTDGKQSQPGK